ncbi:hypothetical protein NGM36_13050 [Streptomyces mutabilis]|nr:hypothetical protein [Streptomyces mutabilis]MCZ9350714.1 hypothetical protein [Streptomyces mutabilis]
MPSTLPGRPQLGQRCGPFGGAVGLLADIGAEVVQVVAKNSSQPDLVGL